MAQELDDMQSFYGDGLVAVIADGFTDDGRLENPTMPFKALELVVLTFCTCITLQLIQSKRRAAITQSNLWVDPGRSRRNGTWPHPSEMPFRC